MALENGWKAENWRKTRLMLNSLDCVGIGSRDRGRGRKSEQAYSHSTNYRGTSMCTFCWNCKWTANSFLNRIGMPRLTWGNFKLVFCKTKLGHCLGDGISLTGETRPVVIGDNLNAKRYRDEILQPMTISCLHLLGMTSLPVDDNTCPHRAGFWICKRRGRNGVPALSSTPLTSILMGSAWRAVHLRVTNINHDSWLASNAGWRMGSHPTTVEFTLWPGWRGCEWFFHTRLLLVKWTTS